MMHCTTYLRVARGTGQMLAELARLHTQRVDDGGVVGELRQYDHRIYRGKRRARQGEGLQRNAPTTNS